MILSPNASWLAEVKLVVAACVSKALKKDLEFDLLAGKEIDRRHCRAAAATAGTRNARSCRPVTDFTKAVNTADLQLHCIVGG
jgi:hypothetical protein